MRQKNLQIYILVVVAALLGVLFLKQVLVTNKNKELTTNDNLMKLSYELIESSNSIFDLQNELNSLRTKNDSFSFDIKDKSKMKDDIEKKTQNYRLINGLDSISGRGIEIKVEGSMVTEEMVDLINGIRNTKPEAIGVDSQRVIYKSYFVVGNDGKLEFDNKKLDFPIYIQVVGDPDMLRKSLDRSGGILDVLKKNSFDKIKFSVENKDNITLPAHDGKINFRYAKNTQY
ncbi:MAG: DUF881 domain-containing protein [Patescibacteria group bacterium]|nr:DUF881 domain-containing protein [Patescibacteria group bacterium]